METRTAKMIVNKSGSGSSTFRATLPANWIRAMGLGEDERKLLLQFKGESIMIKKDKVFLVVTEDGFIIDNIIEEEVDFRRDQVVYESDIESLVEVEMDEGIYENDKEDFDNPVDFFLQNAIREDYHYFIDTHLAEVNLTEEAKRMIQDEVIERIKKERLGMLKLTVKDHGKEEVLKKGTLEEIVDYLQENQEITNWVLDEDPDMELPNLDEVEDVEDLQYELDKIDLSWWALEVEEI